VCDALLPDYAFSLGWGEGVMPDSLPVIPVRKNVPEYSGPPLPWPPGWNGMWHDTTLAAPAARLNKLILPSGADQD